MIVPAHSFSTNFLPLRQAVGGSSEPVGLPQDQVGKGEVAEDFPPLTGRKSWLNPAAPFYRPPHEEQRVKLMPSLFGLARALENRELKGEEFQKAATDLMMIRDRSPDPVLKRQAKKPGYQAFQVEIERPGLGHEGRPGRGTHRGPGGSLREDG